MNHETRSIEQDDEGWWLVECSCGWRSLKAPSLDTAVDDYGDHRSPEIGFGATVASSGGGQVLLLVDRDTKSYPQPTSHVRVLAS